MTPHGHVEGNRYVDPRSAKSFAFDHLRKEASDVQDAEIEGVDGYRAVFESAVSEYVKSHYEKGICTVS